MIHSEIATLLTLAAARDRRTIGEADVLAWHEDLEDIEFDDAREALRRHYRESTDWLMPAHIRAGVMAGRREERRTTPHEIRALPSRFQADDEREERKAAGMAACREAIPKPRPDVERTTAMDRLRELTPGPRWPDPDVTP